jgi:hypothetical protein
MMRMLHYNWCLTGLSVLALGVLALGVPAASAQEQQQDQQQPPQDQSAAPIPAYHSPFASGADNGNAEDNPQGRPADTHALAGAQNLSLGGFETNRSFWQPRFDLSATGDSNAGQNTTNGGWNTWTSFSGGVDVQQVSAGSEMTLGYTGGVMYSNEGAMSNGFVQIFDFADRFFFHRATVTLIDHLSYLPEQAFGFGGLGGVPLQGGGATGLGTEFAPGQSILAGRGQSLTNSSVSELDMYLTPRSSLTLAGGYSVLHYFGSNQLNSVDVIGRVGYNYQLSSKNTIAVLYNFSAIRYNGINQSIDDHTAHVSYGRRITGRLAFQIAGGPEVTMYRMPISGTATNSTQVYWSLNTALQYELRRSDFRFGYSHGVTAGSGVLAGAVTDTVNGAATRKMSRTFTSGIAGGYSRNTGLAIGTISSSQSYNYWFAGATLSHPWGRTLGLTLSYQMQYQNSNIPFCVGLTCGSSVLRHLISVGVGWHERPLPF